MMSTAINELMLLVRCYCFKTILRKEAQFAIHKTLRPQNDYRMSYCFRVAAQVKIRYIDSFFSASILICFTFHLRL